MTIEDQIIINAFGKTMKARREQLGISQENLAFKIKSHATHISRLENGRKQPTLTMIFKICSILEIDPEDLIKEVSKQIL